MQIVGPAGNSRAQITARQREGADPVVDCEQSRVQSLDGGRIGKVDGEGAIAAAREHVLAQQGKAIGEALNVVAADVTIAYVQLARWHVKRAASGKRKRRVEQHTMTAHWWSNGLTKNV